METIQYAIYQSFGGPLIADYSYRVQGLTFASNNRGYAECSCFVPMGLDEAFLLYDRPGLPHVQVTDSATGIVFQGRLEDVAITGDGVTLSALGYSRAMSDSPYTALWSDSSVGGWVPISTSDVATRTPERYQMDTNNRLFIAPQKNATYANTGIVGEFQYTGPDQGSRAIVGLAFDYDMIMPVNWQLIASSWTAGWVRTNLFTLNATGALQTGSVALVFTADNRAGIALFYNAAAAAYAGETGANYVRMTNVRVVTSTTNWINTTLTANRAAGANVTATVGSTARMYMGQRLIINGGGANSESVVVLSIGSTTQFNATFVNAYVIGNTVQAFVIYADEIAKDLVSVMITLNSTQLSSSTALISSPAVDLQNESYADQLPSDILDYLVDIGDASGHQWEWGIRDSQRLYFRQQGSAARTWYVDASDLDVQRTLDLLENSVYAVYSDSASRTLRTAATADSASIARYGVTRRQALSVSTTSATQAGIQQAAALADTKDPKPRALVSVTQVFDAGGSRWPLWSVAAGDTMIIRNLSPTLSTTIDRIRSFRLSRADYDAASDTLHIEPETPRPSLEALLAHIAAGVRV